MKKVWALFKNNLRILILKNKGTFIITTIAPIIILLIISKYISTGSGYMNAVVKDEDNTKSSLAILSTIKNNEGLNVEEDSDINIENSFAQGDIDIAITIPKGFENNLLSGEKPYIDIKENEMGNLNKGIKTSLNLEIKNLKDLAIASDKNYDGYIKALENYSNGTIKIEKLNLNDLKGNYVKTQVFLGFLIMFMFFRAMSGAELINSDKQKNMYTRIFVADIKSSQYYLANILSSFFSILIQVILSLIGLKYIMKLEIGMYYYQLGIILLLVTLIAVSLGTFCISITETRQEASMLSNIVIITFLMIGGCFVPVSLFPNFINKISYFTPTRWAMDSILDLQQGVPFNDIIINLFIMILFALAFFTMSAYKTSKTEKIYKDYN